MKVKKGQLLQFVIFTAAGFLILYLLYRNQSASYLEECLASGKAAGDCVLLDKIIADIKGADYKWILVVLCIYMMSNVFRALRWQMLFKPLGFNVKFSNALYTIIIGYFANLGLPRMGEFIRTGLFSKYEDVPFDKVFGTIVIDRMMDVLSLLVIILLSLTIEYDVLSKIISDNLGGTKGVGSGTLFGILIGAGVLGLLGLFLLFKFGKNTKIGSKLIGFITGVRDGILSVFKLKNPLLFIAYSIGIWVCYYLMTYLCFYAYEPTAHLGPDEGLMTFLFGTLGMVFPSPGGMGSYQYFVTEALQMYGISSVNGFTFANILFFAIQMFCNIFFGLVSLILLPLTNKT